MLTKSKSKLNFNSSPKLSQNLRIIYAVNKEFKNNIKHIRKNIPIIKLYALVNLEEENKTKPKQGMKNINDVQKLIENYELAVSNLRIKYRLSPAYQEPIKDLIENEEQDRVIISFSLPREFWPFAIANPENVKEKITVIKIGSETSISDLQKHWAEIKRDVSMLSKAKPLKTARKENLERDLAIYKLKQAGKTGKEIATSINNDYSDQLIGYQDVAKIIKRLRDYAKKLTGQAE